MERFIVFSTLFLLAMVTVVRSGGSAEYAYDVAIHHPDHYTLGHAKSLHYEARVTPHLSRLHAATFLHSAPAVAVAEKLAVAPVSEVVADHGVAHLAAAPLHAAAYVAPHHAGFAHYAADLPAFHHGDLAHAH